MKHLTSIFSIAITVLMMFFIHHNVMQITYVSYFIVIGLLALFISGAVNKYVRNVANGSHDPTSVDDTVKRFILISSLDYYKSNKLLEFWVPVICVSSVMIAIDMAVFGILFLGISIFTKGFYDSSVKIVSYLYTKGFFSSIEQSIE